VDNVLQMSALEQAKALREREFSSEELTRFYLKRIEERNHKNNAFVRVFSNRALRQARKKDKLLRHGHTDELSIYHGVPTGVKDLDTVRYSRIQFGSRMARYGWSMTDGPVAKRMRQGGFVFLGKLATSEFGILPITETDLHPPCRNPWDLSVTAGGSSGGSASAVAAGMLPIAQASDGGGSIRIPASLCHLFGFKPSRGLMPNFYLPAEYVGLSTVNCVSHTVEDSAAMLDVLTLQKYDPRQPNPESLLFRCQKAPRSLRIGVWSEPILGEMHPEVMEALQKTAKALEELGHHVEEKPPEQATLEEFLPVWSGGITGIPIISKSLVQPATYWLHREGKKYKKEQVLARAEELRGRIDRWFGQLDIIISPTIPVPPFQIGFSKELSGEEVFRQTAVFGAFTAIFNLGGHPATSFPAGLSSQNHPIGIQLAAKRGQDAQLLALSKQLETAMPWVQRNILDCS